MLTLLLLFFCCSVNSLIINTNYGSIRGKSIIQNQKLHHSFKRIPFAKPPIGNLRFQKPENPDYWHGIRNGTVYGPACMSNSTTSKSVPKWVDEDCLHLNIFVSDFCLKSKNCSVAVYIHGGGINYDSAVMFNDTCLFNSFTTRDVILVIPGFRLGIFSHLIFTDQKVVPYNIAIYDILKALEFVHSEIESFGGNPNSVTLMGHSYGGTITSHLLFSTKINQDLRLFQKVISMSSPSEFLSLQSFSEKIERFVKRTGCDTTRKYEQDLYVLKCLQSMTSHEILRTQRELEEEDPNFLFQGVIQELPLFQTGSISDFHQNPKKIPYLTGVVLKEFDRVDDEKTVGEIFDFKNPEAVHQKFENEKRQFNHTDKTIEIFVDTKYRVLKVLETKAPVYLYQYSNLEHSYHTDDLFYIMGVHSFNKSIDEQKLSEVYPEYFMNFIKSGKPADNWKVTNGTTYFDIDWNEKTGKRPIMRNGFEKKINDFWFIEMRDFDNFIEKSKHLTFKSSNTSVLSEIDTNYVVWVSSFLIFVVGILVGRCLCARKRNVYIRIPGDSYYEKAQL